MFSNAQGGGTHHQLFCVIKIKIQCQKLEGHWKPYCLSPKGAT